MINIRQFGLRHEKTIGSVASVLAIIMFISLIEIAISNAMGRSEIVIQPAATFLSGGIWSLYAYARKDWFLLAPNALACVLGLVTVVTAFV